MHSIHARTLGSAETGVASNTSTIHVLLVLPLALLGFLFHRLRRIQRAPAQNWASRLSVVPLFLALSADVDVVLVVHEGGPSGPGLSCLFCPRHDLYRRHYSAMVVSEQYGEVGQQRLAVAASKELAQSVEVGQCRLAVAALELVKAGPRQLVLPASKFVGFGQQNLG